MEVNELIELLSSGSRLEEFLTCVGRDCLNNFKRVLQDRYYNVHGNLYKRVMSEVVPASREVWAHDGSFLAGPDANLIRHLEMLSSTPNLAALCVLEGVCRGVATDYFATAHTIVRIERGMVTPLPQRHLRDWKDATPNPKTPRSDLLDPDSEFVIWSNEWTLELDFTFSDRIEHICWPIADNDPKKPRLLPLIASVHPFLGKDMSSPDEMTDTAFFGVHPIADTAEDRDKNTQAVVSALKAAGDHAPIAVVPEFTLHTPEAVDGCWDHNDPPWIMVSGSAHCEDDDGTRSNTSITYLDGVPLLEVSKYYPFNYRRTVSDGNSNTPRKVESKEAITPRDRTLRVIASSSTRLAVAICSDLNSPKFLSALTDAAVNILLCPAWTPKRGTFPGAIDTLASYNQCVSLVANTPGHPSVAGDPFWALTRVPRESTAHITHWSDPEHRIGVLNPNLPPSSNKYFVWKSSSGG